MNACPAIYHSLLAQVQLGDQGTIPFDVGLLQVVQQTTALANHQQQTTAAVVILLVQLQMLVQMIDAAENGGKSK